LKKDLSDIYLTFSNQSLSEDVGFVVVALLPSLPEVVSTHALVQLLVNFSAVLLIFLGPEKTNLNLLFLLI
jgi:hypothetical protein